MEGATIVDHQGDLILHKTSPESELSFYNTSDSLEEEGESDSSPDMGISETEACSSKSPPPVSVAVSGANANIRTPRALRKSMKSAKPSTPTKKTTFGLKFRSTGTKESIDRSTCSTVVGSTHGDNTITSRRVRQGSDLSALSHCSEVSETNPAAWATMSQEPELHDYEATDPIETAQEEGLDSHGASSPRSRRKAFLANKVSHMAPNFEESDWTSQATLTFVAMGENNSSINDEHDDSSPEGKMDTDQNKREDNDYKDLGFKDIDSTCMEHSVSSFRQSSSLSQDGVGRDINVGVDDNENSSTSSSDDEIAFDDSSSAEAGSIPILGSTLHLTDSSRDLGSNNSNTKKKKKGNPATGNRCDLSPGFVRSVNAVRLVCGKVVNHPFVQNCIVFLIIMNALEMGIATFDFVDQDDEMKATFDQVDMAFLIIFTIESALQLIFHGPNLFRDGWHTFDFLIVVCSWAFGSMQVFRTLRTLRLVARVEILRKLCEALMEAVPRLTGILFLFILIMYIYAVMVTVLFGDMYERGLTSMDYFSRLDTTLFTLFQMITLDWARIVREVMETYPLAYVVFSTYLTFTSFILFSLIIGVVCDAVSAIEHDATLLEQIQQKEDAQERILRLQHQVDYLKKQQKSVLASVQTVLDEIVEQERFGGPLRASDRSLNTRNMRGSAKNLGSSRHCSSLNSSRRSIMRSSRRSSLGLIPPREDQRSGDTSTISKGGYGETTDSVIGQHLSAFG